MTDPLRQWVDNCAEKQARHYAATYGQGSDNLPNPELSELIYREVKRRGTISAQLDVNEPLLWQGIATVFAVGLAVGQRITSQKGNPQTSKALGIAAGFAAVGSLVNLARIPIRLNAALNAGGEGAITQYQLAQEGWHVDHSGFESRIVSERQISGNAFPQR